MATRREIILSGAAAIAGGALLSRGEKVRAEEVPLEQPVSATKGQVSVPNGSVLPFRIVDGIKIFHLIVAPMQWEFCPGLTSTCWGYNGSTPGPLIEVVEGDRCRLYVTNRLPEPTTVHMHGIILPNGMDGVSGLTQKSIAPGETFRYEVTFNRAGTFMYHPHYDEMTQMGLGLAGMIVVHPKDTSAAVDYDFSYILGEWSIKPGTSRPDPTEMTGFNILTLNGKAYPGTAPLLVRRNSRVRIRFGNLSAMDHHPVHFHGLSLTVTETDGGTVPLSARWPETTVLVPVGTVRVVEFVPTESGDWPFHCHMTHHIMNQMGHGLPNLMGVNSKVYDKAVEKLLPDYMPMGTTGSGEMMAMDVPKNSIPMLGGKGPFGTIDMGGMFSILKVRDSIPEDPSAWFNHPPGTVARPATSEELAQDLPNFEKIPAPKVKS